MSENNNNTFQNRVSTSGITLFDENGIMLRLGYLDDSLSLLMGEPKLADNGKRSYPQEMRHPFIITMDRASALYNEIILKKVLKAMEDGEDYDGGIFLNKRKDAIFEIRVQQGEVYLVYYKDIKEDRTPTDTYVFKCNKTNIVENYNPDGTNFEQSNVEGVFMVFCKYLEAGIYDIHNSSAHAFRKGNNYTTTSIFNHLKAIAAKLGATVSSGYSNQNHTPFSADAGTTDLGEDIPFNEMTQTSESLSDLLS